MTDREKIKATLRFCSDKIDNCIGCPVFSSDNLSDCTSNVMNAAANIIDKLEAENVKLAMKILRIEKEGGRAKVIKDRYRKFYDRIAPLHDCNDCADRRKCKYQPKIGEVTRINCPLWKGNHGRGKEKNFKT